jgi:aspartate ammonia-lyase
MRIEEDFIGKVKVPDDAYYGSFTARAKENFQLSGTLVRIELIHAVALIKKCAARTNQDLGRLDKKVADAITRSADEVMQGKLDNEFVLDAFQAGAGTPLHMNVNEVIANRAEELLGGRKGKYAIIHPNNHVNMSQSSNDVVPSAARIAAIALLAGLLAEAGSLQKSLERKAARYKDAAKIGRTHLQDAVPMSYGQTFHAWARAIERDLQEISKAGENLGELGIGGTATGSGITAHPGFRESIVRCLNAEAGLGVKLRMAKDPIQMTQDMNDFITFSGALKRLASTLSRIANDMRILASGPEGGIGELILPEVEPGSSIMPGKINPSVPEAVDMVAWQVMANDLSILLAAQSGQLELNFGAPLIANSVLQSESMLTSCCSMLRRLCVEGMEVDAARAKGRLERSFAYATAFIPYLGYKEVSALVREARGKGVSLKELIAKKGIMTQADIDKVILSANGPSEADEGIRMRKG